MLCSGMTSELSRCSPLFTLTVQVERRSRRVPGGREIVEKPQAVVEYNKYMGGVDRGDQLWLPASHSEVVEAGLLLPL